MTFVGHIVYLFPSSMMLLGPQIIYMPSKSHVIVLLPCDCPIPKTKDGKNGAFWLSHGFILEIRGNGGLLFHFILSKIVAHYFECFRWKVKYYIYQHLEIVCKCWLYLVNTRSLVQRKKEVSRNKKGSVLNFILS